MNEKASIVGMQSYFVSEINNEIFNEERIIQFKGSRKFRGFL